MKQKHEEDVRELREQLEMLKIQDYECRQEESSASAKEKITLVNEPMPTMSVINSDLELGCDSDRKISVGNQESNFDQFRMIPRGECEVSSEF